MELKKGDVVQFGTYYGEPITWRVIELDEHGALLVSSKIIALKPFDAAGPKHRDSQRATYGSNNWERSNLRQWLNSEEDEINWLQNAPEAAHVWKGYNPYAGEKGFLANFTALERSLLRSTSHETELTSADGGGRAVTTDRVFPLSSAEFKALVDKTPYEPAQLTQAAVDHSRYNNNGRLDTAMNWRYWTRSPYPNNPHSMFFVIAGGFVIYDNAANYGNVGVRPACYIAPAEAVVQAGDGTAAAPYVITGSGRTATSFGGTADTAWYLATPGGGTADNPYVLHTAADLAGLAVLVDRGDDFTGKHVALATDVDLGGSEWMPVGGWDLAAGEPLDSVLFNGSFDGRGHWVRGLRIGDSARKVRNTRVRFAGLFGVIGAEGQVRNVGVAGDIYSALEGGTLAGGVAAINRGTVESCAAAVDIDCAGTHTNYTGGVVAVSYWVVANCWSTGNVRTSGGVNNRAAGIAGYNGIDSTTVNSYARGDITAQGASEENFAGGVGSIVKNIMTNCYSTGKISASGAGRPAAGGVAALNFSTGIPDGDYWNATLNQAAMPLNENSAPVGHLPGLPQEEMRSDAFAALLNKNVADMGDKSLKAWYRDDKVNDGFPTLERG